MLVKLLVCLSEYAIKVPRLYKFKKKSNICQLKEVTVLRNMPIFDDHPNSSDAEKSTSSPSSVLSTSANVCYLSASEKENKVISDEVFKKHIENV